MRINNKINLSKNSLNTDNRSSKWLIFICIALNLLVIMLLVITFLLLGTDTDINNKTLSKLFNNRDETTLKTVDIDNSKIDVKSVDTDLIEYIPTLISEMESEIDKNPFRANNKYLGEFVEIKCKLDSAYSSGMTLLVYELNDIRDIPFRVICNLTLDEHRDILFKLDDNEPLIIKGKVIDVDNMLGYTVEVHNIVYDVKKVRSLNPEYESDIHGIKEYKHISIDELYRQLYENAYRANKNINGSYIETRCRIVTIDSDGEYITVGNIDKGEIQSIDDLDEAINDWLEDIDISINCNIGSNIDDNTLEMFNQGSEVVIRGQIVEVNYPSIYKPNYVINLDYISYE